MKLDVIVFDLDGTLCQLKQESDKNKHTGDELPIKNMVTLANAISGKYGYEIVILTGRKEEYDEITYEWLCKNNIEFYEIYMQEGRTAKKNHIFKREKLIEMQKKYNIIALFDDNPEMIPVCKELGILLLQVHN